MKVIFLWFNLNTPVGMNIGVSLLSRELMESGHNVKIMHLNEQLGYPFDIEKILEDSKNFNPDLFAISFGSNHFSYVKMLIPFLKKMFPEKPIICGGIHTTLSPEEVISLEGVDIVCIGEADRILLEFIDNLERGKEYKSSLSFWVKSGNKIYKNLMAPLPDIRNQTYQNYDLIDYGKLTELKRGFIDINAGRGCPYSCSFCQNKALREIYFKSLKTGTSKVNYCRLRNVNNLIGEMEKFCNILGKKLKGVFFSDDTITLDKNWLKDFAKVYPEVINKPFVCNVGVNEVDEEVVDLLNKAGCNVAKFGIESGAFRIRKLLNKPFSQQKLISAIKLFQSRDINIQGYVMIGLPTETASEMLDTFKLISMLKIDIIRPSIFYPFPRTKLFEFCKNKSLIKEGKDSTTYSKDSILSWDHSMLLFIDKVKTIFPWLLNKYLNNLASEKYGKLVEEVFCMSSKEWNKIKDSGWISRNTQLLSEFCKSKNIPHYINPFSDRPDSAFLIRNRKKKIINIDD